MKFNDTRMNMEKTKITKLSDADQGDKKQSVQRKIESKFLEQRKIFLWGQVDDESAEDIVSKLLYLESTSPGEKITFFINSPGGIVTSGFSILDTMSSRMNVITIIKKAIAAAIPNSIPRCQFR